MSVCLHRREALFVRRVRCDVGLLQQQQQQQQQQQERRHRQQAVVCSVAAAAVAATVVAAWPGSVSLGCKTLRAFLSFPPIASARGSSSSSSAAPVPEPLFSLPVQNSIIAISSSATKAKSSSGSINNNDTGSEQLCCRFAAVAHSAERESK
ncbi:uncharacterized protein LOC111254235 [Varroa destructor]|uniref:Uncharacterized protein n=1 Tax=Varroa destructor TaxID=109461 RepID=A0A7M7KTX7_VARDE|nr:uncharacterized protein LOC111254235 [Varroa destructor]